MDRTDSIRRLELRLPAEPRSARAARQAVRQAVFDLVDEATAQDVQLLVTELVTNSVRHGARTPAEIKIDVCVERTAVTVEVEDQGPGFDGATLPPSGPPPEGEGGWGLVIVSRVANRWGTRRTPHGFSVWFIIERREAA